MTHLGGKWLGKVAGVGTALVAGAASAASEALAGSVDLADTGVNALVATVAGNTETGRNARKELSQAVETAKYVVENADVIGGQLVDSAVDTAVGVAKGDVESITRFTAVIADVASGGKATLAKAGRLGRQVKRARDSIRRAGRRVEAQAPRPTAVAPKADGRTAEPKYCFAAGTLVATMTGLRPIEEIEPGDQVWSRNEATGETALREVTQLFVTPNQAIYEVDAESEDGTVET